MSLRRAACLSAAGPSPSGLSKRNLPGRYARLVVASCNARTGRRTFPWASRRGRLGVSSLAICLVQVAASRCRRHGVLTAARRAGATAASTLPLATSARRRYFWEKSPRNIQEAFVYVPVGSGVRPSQLEVVIRARKLSIQIRGEPDPMIDCLVLCEVDPLESYWDIDVHNGNRCVIVTLCKRNAWEDFGDLLSDGAVGSRQPELPVDDGDSASCLCTLEPSEWCAYYINLERRPDRRTRLLQVLSVANKPLMQQLERIDAVDGRNITLDSEAARLVVDEKALMRARRAKDNGEHTIVHKEGALVYFNDHLTEGGVACAMSHREALRKIAAHPSAGWGLILEDDIIAAAPHADRIIARILQKLPPEWDAVFLGYHDSRGKPHPTALSAHTEAGQTPVVVDVPVLPMRWEGVWGFHAWMIRKEAAQLLLDNAFPISGQVDNALSSWLVRERGRSFKVEPGSMVFYSLKSEAANDSDVQSMVSLDAILQEQRLPAENESNPDRWDDHIHGGAFAPPCEAPAPDWPPDFDDEFDGQEPP